MSQYNKMKLQHVTAVTSCYRLLPVVTCRSSFILHFGLHGWVIRRVCHHLRQDQNMPLSSQSSQCSGDPAIPMDVEKYTRVLGGFLHLMFHLMLHLMGMCQKYRLMSLSCISTGCKPWQKLTNKFQNWQLYLVLSSYIQTMSCTCHPCHMFSKAFLAGSGMGRARCPPLNLRSRPCRRALGWWPGELRRTPWWFSWVTATQNDETWWNMMKHDESM